jgi:hypothetical protein
MKNSDANIDQLAQLLLGNKHINPVFRGAVGAALMKVGEDMAAEKIMEDRNEYE